MWYLFTSKNPTTILVKWLLILAVCLVVVVYYKKTNHSHTEAFTQDKPFVLKRDSECYDTFYTEIYDGLWKREEVVQKELAEMVKATEPSTRRSVFLDVGSGTGYLVSELTNAGYNAYGIDKSQAMIDYSNKTFPEIEVKCGDVLDPMAYENATFTHILCTHFTIYHLENKKQFFDNCHRWLQPNGYLCLHLVDRNKFDTIIPVGKPTFLRSPQLLSEKRITDTTVEFDDLTYHSTFQCKESSTLVVQKETFTDKKTSHVRQHEKTFYMEDIEAILEIARFAGFIQKSMMTMMDIHGDPYQHLYLLERI